MGPMEHGILDKDDTKLQAAREANPDWDIYRVFGGYLAVPKGTLVIQAIDTDGVVEKLRRQA